MDFTLELNEVISLAEKNDWTTLLEYFSDHKSLIFRPDLPITVKTAVSAPSTNFAVFSGVPPLSSLPSISVPSYYTSTLKGTLLGLLLNNYSPPLEVVKALVNQNPEQLKNAAISTNSLLPLHLSVQRCTVGELSEDILIFLKESHLPAVMTPCNGQYPLHVAINAWKPESSQEQFCQIMQHLIPSDLSILRTTSPTGLLPIEMALQKGCNLEIIKSLLVTDCKKGLISKALSGCCSYDVVDHIINFFLVQIQNNAVADFGETLYNFLKIALQKHLPSAIVSLLLNKLFGTQTAPEVVNIFDLLIEQGITTNFPEQDALLPILEVFIKHFPYVISNTLSNPTSSAPTIIKASREDLLHKALNAGHKFPVIQLLHKYVGNDSLRKLMQSKFPISTKSTMTSNDYAIYLILEEYWKHNHLTVAEQIEVVEFCLGCLPIDDFVRHQLIWSKRKGNNLIMINNMTMINDRAQTLLHVAVVVQPPAAILEKVFALFKPLFQQMPALYIGLISACVDAYHTKPVYKASDEQDAVKRNSVINDILMFCLEALPPNAPEVSQPLNSTTNTYLIHEVVKYASIAVLSKCIALNPSSVRIPMKWLGKRNGGRDGYVDCYYDNGPLPLHLAVGQPDRISILLGHFPDSILVRSNGNTALQLAIEKRCSKETIQLLLHDLEKANAYSSYCYSAIKNQSSLDVLKVLTQKYQNEVTKSLFSSAISTYTSWNEILDFLFHLVLQKNEDSKANNCDLLHLMIEKKYPVNDIKKITESFPEEIHVLRKSVRNAGKELIYHYENVPPLITALLYNPSCELIEYLIEKDPVAVRTKLNGGYLRPADYPLIISMLFHVSHDVSELLLKHYPDCVLDNHVSSSATLPIWQHVLRDSETSDVHQELLDDNESSEVVVDNAVDTSNSNNENTENTENTKDTSSVVVNNFNPPSIISAPVNVTVPIKSAASLKVRSLQTSSSLVASICCAALAKDKSLFKMILCERELSVATATTIIKTYFAAHPEHVIELCKVTYPLIQKKKIQKLLHEYLFFCGRYEQMIFSAPLHCSATSVVIEFLDHGVVGEYISTYTDYVESGGKLTQAFSKLDIGVNSFHEDQLNQYVQSIQHEHKKEVTSDATLSETQEAELSVLSKNQYEEYCKANFGSTRKVVIKFMKDEIQYNREKLLRNDRQLSPKYIVPLLKPNLSWSVFTKQILDHRVKFVAPDYNHGLIMPSADRSLDAIFRSERPDLNMIRSIMYEVGLAVQHCHENHIVHGDLKMLNILRVEGHMRLIDFDAAVEISQDDQAGFVGAKFSSGILPPEMFASLSSQQQENDYNDYWTAEKEEMNKEGQVSYWNKIKPRVVQSKQNGYVKQTSESKYVVRTFRSLSLGAPERPSQLPYRLVKASVSFDVWSFGALLYALLTGESLLSVNRDDDLINDKDYAIAANWTASQLASKIHEKLLPVDDTNTTESEKEYAAVDLLQQLLHPDPKIRGQKSMKEYLLHPFFGDVIMNTVSQSEMTTNDSDKLSKEILNQLAVIQHQNVEIMKRLHDQQQLLQLIALQNHRIEQETRRISYMNYEMMTQIKRTEKVMLKALIEAEDVNVPSCFVILNQKLYPVIETEDQEEKTQQSEQVYSLEDVAKLEEEEIVSSTHSSVPPSKGSMMKRAHRWTKRLGRLTELVSDNISKVTESVSAVMENDYKTVFQNAVDSLVTGERLYLYLVDEYTMKPVIDHPSYPIEITKPSEFIPKVLPLLKLTLKAASAYNTVACIPRCLGYPIPILSQDLMDTASSAVGKLSQKSSVQEYDVLQRVLDAGATGANQQDESQIKSYRGASLREFARFLAEYDKDCTFANLKRVLTQDGMCCWTLPEHIKHIEASEDEENTGMSAAVVAAKTPRGTKTTVTSYVKPSLPPPPLPPAAPLPPSLPVESAAVSVEDMLFRQSMPEMPCPPVPLRQFFVPSLPPPPPLPTAMVDESSNFYSTGPPLINVPPAPTKPEIVAVVSAPPVVPAASTAVKQPAMSSVQAINSNSNSNTSSSGKASSDYEAEIAALKKELAAAKTLQEEQSTAMNLLAETVPVSLHSMERNLLAALEQFQQEMIMNKEKEGKSTKEKGGKKDSKWI